MLSSNAIIDLSCERIATRSYEYMLQRTDLRTDTRCTAFWVLRVCCTTNIGLCTMYINQHYCHMLLSTDYREYFVDQRLRRGLLAAAAAKSPHPSMEV